MRFYLLAAMILMGQLVFAGASEFSEKPLIAKEMNGDVVKSTFIVYLKKDAQSQTYRPQGLGIIAGAFLGACFSEDFTPCSLTLSIKELYATAFKNMTGKANPDVSNFPNLPDISITTQTTVTKTDAAKIEVTVGAMGNSTKYTLEKLPYFSEVKLNLFQLTKDESQRKDLTEVDQGLKDYAQSVVQIEKESDSNNTLHDSAGFGTGFFLSTDGYMMTNHHVISMYPDCLDKFYCQIKLNQIGPDQVRKTYVTNAYLLTYSIQHDFALLKIKVPTELKIRALSIDLSQSGEDLLTFGYPGDRKGSDGNTKLTFSFGKLTGFYSLGLMTSVYIAAGASGSPMLNAKNMAITGIVSNGAGSTSTGEGDPGVFRPITLINAEFGLSDYLNGSKQKRVQGILRQLSTVADPTQARKLLETLKSEKTNYGVPYLKELMIGHSSKPVRKEIMKVLQEMSVVAGK